MKIHAPETASTPAAKKPLYKSLFFQIVMAVVAGIVIGYLWPNIGSALRPLGDGFIQLIKMIIAPLIFLVIVTGISAVGDVRAVGRVGVKALVYFTAATLFALAFGLVVANVVQPGAGLNIDPASLSEDAVNAKITTAPPKDAGQFLLGIIPTSVVGAFASNSLLQVLCFAVFFGAAIVVVGREKCKPVIDIMETTLEIFFRIMAWVMRVAPVGAFGAMAFIIGQYGLSSLSTYALLVAACYGSALIFIGLLFVVAWAYPRVPLWQFIKYSREEFMLALGTASTESVLPRIMTKLTNAGCSRATTGLVVPTGYSFNLDGAALYLSISLLFLAQAFGHNLDLGQQLAALGILMLTSKGMAGVPGSAFLALSATAGALGIFPVAGVALLLGADRLMDSMRVVVNLLGNCVATFVVSKWEGQFDREAMLAAFRGETTTPEEGDAVTEPTVPTLSSPQPRLTAGTNSA
ncbi:cation:dicarboxylase symporter family transporter [Paenarthrobacter sp. UW852]|uniref:cation:dicarboxylate symporter family transporter n=1 Tax=Paenarthrobacter sp. UW852 TaxID=2951989 RepID=UPI0021496432|nr:cation:dicarboxylase symporter family transporter [Paenarthrobacter sp. UW852]MCR1162370.1 cation:dicarboxylase symporter family transporter [Paenarthrobacter sp. UW852]